MFGRLKKTRLGKNIHHVLRRPDSPWVLRILVRLIRQDLLQLSHLSPRHILHNRRQNVLLKKFETGLE